MTTSPPDAAAFPFVSLREASAETGCDRRYIRGAADMIGIRLIPRGRALLMARHDFERLKERLAAGGATA